MEASFWHERWAKREIGFHMPKPHDALLRHWPKLGLAAGSTVFVPLAGKSLDLCWLAERGHRVVGIELSPTAVAEFHAENPDAQNIDLLCGDFFELTRAALGPVTAVFDRAALVALPADMRAAYVSHLIRLTEPGTRMLLVTMEYEQSQMRGPPHAVLEDEVRSLYDATHAIERLERLDVLADYPRMIERGVTGLHESIYLLERR
jgi:thiopurine S-methyltransferase